VQDILLRDPHDRPYLRYIALPHWATADWHGINSFLVNSAVSTSSNVVLPDGAAGGWLIVWDLRRLAPKDSDFKRVASVWDSMFVGEPYFHVELAKKHAVACRPFTVTDGKV